MFNKNPHNKQENIISFTMVELIVLDHIGDRQLVNSMSTPLGPLTWHYPPHSCPSGRPSWPGLPRTLPSLEPGWWRAGRAGPTQNLAPRRQRSLHRKDHQDSNIATFEQTTLLYLLIEKCLRVGCPTQNNGQENAAKCSPCYPEVHITH